MARPTKYSDEIVTEILSRFSDGETLSSICQDNRMPKRNTIYRWRRRFLEFDQAYLLAQEEHSDALVDKAGEIVDEELDPQRAKVRADHRKWLASRLNRQKYGDKVEVQHKHSIDIKEVLFEAQSRLQELK